MAMAQVHIHSTCQHAATARRLQSAFCHAGPQAAKRIQTPTARPIPSRSRPLVAVCSSARDVVAAAAVLDRPATVAEPAITHNVVTLTPETFWSFLEENKDTPVCVDFFTDWCGPCKLIAPELQNMSVQYAASMKFAKINCGTCDRSFPKSMNIKALPTFHVYKKSEKVGDFTGARSVQLRRFLETHM